MVAGHPVEETFQKNFTSWWFEPIWKISVKKSKWESPPRRGENKKHLKPPKPPPSLREKSKSKKSSETILRTLLTSAARAIYARAPPLSSRWRAPMPTQLLQRVKFRLLRKSPGTGAGAWACPSWHAAGWHLDTPAGFGAQDQLASHVVACHLAKRKRPTEPEPPTWHGGAFAEVAGWIVHHARLFACNSHKIWKEGVLSVNLQGVQISWLPGTQSWRNKWAPSKLSQSLHQCAQLRKNTRTARPSKLSRSCTNAHNFGKI